MYGQWSGVHGEYHRQSIVEGIIKKERAVEEMRRAVRNRRDWTLNMRLQRIKDAITVVARNLAAAVPAVSLPSHSAAVGGPAVAFPSSQPSAAESDSIRGGWKGNKRVHNE